MRCGYFDEQLALYYVKYCGKFSFNEKSIFDMVKTLAIFLLLMKRVLLCEKISPVNGTSTLQKTSVTLIDLLPHNS